MEIFKRRPLLFMCFIFALFSAFGYFIKELCSLWIIILLFTLFVILTTVFFVLKKKRFWIIIIAFCILSATLALLNNNLRVHEKLHVAEELEGKRMTECLIISKKDIGDHYTSYEAKLLRAGDKETDLNVILFTYFPSELDVGDVVFARSEIMVTKPTVAGMGLSDLTNSPMYSSINAIYEEYDVLVLSNNKPLNVFTREGLFRCVYTVKGYFSSLNDSLSDIFNELLGERIGGLATAFLNGDRSGMSVSDIRNFRRVGLLHLLAVSGLHITLMMGFSEAILRRIYVPRKIRIALNLIFSILLLFLADFSGSATRSVFMFWIFYITYFLNEENDSLTSLFLSAALIILISPYSVEDIGFIMSFLATLGLLTYYIIYDRYIREKIYGEGTGFIKKAFLKLSLAVVMTLSANFFILPITYYFFGEFSLISILGNIIIAPFSSFFLVALPFLLLLGNVPLIGYLLSFACRLCGDIMLYLSEKLSDIPFAVVSLRYDFCFWIVLVTTLVLILLLAVKLKHKWLLISPFVLGVLSFCICLAIFNAGKGQKTLHYMSVDDDEFFIATNKGSAAVIDLSGGDLSSYVLLKELCSSYGATEIKKLIFTDYAHIDISELEYSISKDICREVYIPLPNTDEEKESFYEIYDLLRGRGIYVGACYSEKEIELLSEIYLVCDGGDDGVSDILNIVLNGKVISYIKGYMLNDEDGILRIKEKAEITDLVIVGAEGYKEEYGEKLLPVDLDNKRIIRSKAIISNISGSPNEWVIGTEDMFYISLN